MAKKTVNIGTSANKGNGDPLRTAFGKINDNFDELYALTGDDVQIPAQTTHTGKFLTTNGTTLSWASGDGDRLVNGANTVSLGTDGSLTLPGDIRSEGAVNIDINLSDSTLRRWRFGEDGELTFPDGTNQATAYTGGSLPTVVNASFQINDASFTPGSSYAATPYSITVTPSSTSAPISVTFNLSIVANTGQEDAGYAFKIYVNGSAVNSSEIINYIDDSPTSYSAYPATYTFNFVPGTNSSTTIALWARKTGGNGWKFSKGIASTHVVTALVF
jgi:hypothetical protein